MTNFSYLKRIVNHQFPSMFSIFFQFLLILSLKPPKSTESQSIKLMPIEHRTSGNITVLHALNMTHLSEEKDQNESIFKEKTTLTL